MHSPWRWRQHIPPKHRNRLTILHGVITWKTEYFIFSLLVPYCGGSSSTVSLKTFYPNKFYKAHYELSQRTSHFLDCQSSDSSKMCRFCSIHGATLNIECLVRIPQEKKCLLKNLSTSVRKVFKCNLENLGFEGIDWDGVHFNCLPADQLSPFLRKTINGGK